MGAWMSAGGDHKPVEVDLAPVVQLEPVSFYVESTGAVAQTQVQAERLDLLWFTKKDAVEPPGARQELLRQGGPFVGEVAFGTDQHDPAFETSRAKRLGRAKSSQ
jgi:hypothetical protein